jgi:hypothetical protein
MMGLLSFHILWVNTLGWIYACMYVSPFSYFPLENPN